MKKICILSLVFLLAVFLSACTTSKTTWQGVYYPDGCLDCESEWVFSPTFYDFESCKEWAYNKKTSLDDKMSCAKNCQGPGGSGPCDDPVIRNWKIFPDSVTFEEYKE